MTAWIFALWVIFTWTAAVEQLVWGTAVALLLAGPLAGTGRVARPWKALAPRRMWAASRLLAVYLARMTKANLGLARRIWTPRLPLRSGMVLVADPTTTDGSLTWLALMTSTIVDNQLVDVDDASPPGHRRLQYHGVWIPTFDPDANAARIEGSIPRWLELIATGIPKVRRR